MATYRGQGTVNAATTTSNSQVREVFTATASQTVFNTSFTYTVGLNQLDVYLQGVKQLLTTDYVETDSNTITFVSGVTLDEVVEIEGTIGGEIVDTDAASNITFTHDSAGAVQTTVEASLKAQNLELVAELKTLDGAQNQRADVRGLTVATDSLGGRYYWDSTSTATDTSATTGNVVQQTGVATGRWTRVSTNSFTGDIAFQGVHTNTETTQSTSTTTGSTVTSGGLGVAKDVNIGGNVDVGTDIVINEAADHTTTPTAGTGILWVQNTAPATLFFTNDVGGDIDLSAAGGTVTLADEQVDTTCFPMYSTAATGSVSPKSNANLTYNAATEDFASTTFTGALVGNADTATTAATVTTAAQTTITSLGTQTILNVDNLRIDGNTLSSVTGAINITPTIGSAINLDGISVDGLVVTGASSITSTDFVGALTGNVTGNTSGTAATVTTAAQPNITSVGTLTGFTSTGINDNASTEVVSVGDTNMTLGKAGSIFQLRQFSDDQTLSISGGTTSGLGGNFLLYGQSHSTAANDIYIRTDANIIQSWNDDIGQWKFYTGTGTPVEALQLDSSQNANFNGTIAAQNATFAGDVTVSGGNITVDNMASSTALKFNNASNGRLSFGGSGTNSYINAGTGDGADGSTLYIRTSTSGGTLTIAQTIDRDQNTTFAGNINAVAGGINLGATGAANLLDAYEEGNWTPSFSTATNSTGTWTTTLTGRYTKVGNKVTVWIEITGSAMRFTSVNGNREYVGLPFPVDTTYSGSGSFTSPSTSINFGGLVHVDTSFWLYAPQQITSTTTKVVGMAVYRT